MNSKSDFCKHDNAPISYSAVLQGKAKPALKILKRIPGEALAIDEIFPTNEDAQEAPSTSLADSIPKKEKRKSSRKPNANLSLSEFVFASSLKQNVFNPIKTKHLDEKIKIPPKVSAVTGNVLDSSAPQFHKGKYRENKTKKPSTMKKIILKDREERKSEQEQNKNSSEFIIADVPVRQVHSRKFRNYCDNVITDELNQAVTMLITELVRFQDRQYAKDAEKAKLKRRMVCGLREVKKLIKVDKIRCLVIAPNVEQGQSEGGLTDVLDEILNDCRANNIPYLFALNRHGLGYVTRKRRPLACVGVLNYQGAEQHFKRSMELLEEARAKYEEIKLAADSCVTTDEEQTKIYYDNKVNFIQHGKEDKSTQLDDILPDQLENYSFDNSGDQCFNLDDESNQLEKETFCDDVSSFDSETIVLVNNFQTLLN